MSIPSTPFSSSPMAHHGQHHLRAFHTLNHVPQASHQKHCLPVYQYLDPCVHQFLPPRSPASTSPICGPYLPVYTAGIHQYNIWTVMAVNEAITYYSVCEKPNGLPTIGPCPVAPITNLFFHEEGSRRLYNESVRIRACLLVRLGREWRLLRFSSYVEQDCLGSVDRLPLCSSLFETNENFSVSKCREWEFHLRLQHRQ